MRDAYDSLSDIAQTAVKAGSLYDVLYADDTVLLTKKPLNVMCFGLFLFRTPLRRGRLCRWSPLRASEAPRRASERPSGRVQRALVFFVLL